MSSARSKAPPSLVDFADLFETLGRAGTAQVVIGGCAVGAYAHLLGESVTSDDLDLYASQAGYEAILAAASGEGGRIVRRARERSIPVAVIDWKGKELNVVTATAGLLSPEIEAELAREFVLPGKAKLAVLVADPFQLLSNKLAVNRPKDRPHIAILRRFVEGEVVLAFREETQPRKRIAPAAKMLRIEKKGNLPAGLMTALSELAREPSDFRFLANHAPSRATGRALLERAPTEEIEAEVQQILKARRQYG
jgi:hypothetical protein